MGAPILVTGGTGTLGREVVRRLAADGHEVRATGRRPRPAGEPGPAAWAVADLSTGRGVAPAVAGAEVIVHCVTAHRRGRPADEVRALVEAALAAGRPRPHLVYVSIVGVDRIPFPYYRGKLAAERLIADSGLPYTILRATQFHDLVRTVLAAGARLPVMPVPGLRFQPVDVREVAARLARLATAPPAGRVPDMGGPEVRDARDLARAYLRATGRRRPVAPVRLPGAAFTAFRSGHNLTPDHAEGRITFGQYLTEQPDPRRVAYRGRRG
ncbi:NAD(P)H-binding protein [Streptomyces capparidis]